MPQRYEREIDDILRRMGGGPRRGTARRLSRLFSRAGTSLGSLLARFRRRSTVEQLMIASIVLWLGSIPLGWIFPGSALVRTMNVVGIVCFLAALVLSFAQHRRYGPSEKRWRGRVIDYRPASFSLGWYLRRWWRRLRGY